MVTFKFDVVHRKTHLHGNADALSRVSHAGPEEDDVERNKGAVGYVVSAMLPIPFSLEKLKTQQTEDATLKKVIAWVERKQAPSASELRLADMGARHLAGIFSDLCFDANGILCRLLPASDDLAWTRSQVYYIPNALQDQLVRYCHKFGGHQGRDRTYQRVRELAFFPQMWLSVDHFVKTCKACQAADQKHKDQPHTYYPMHDCGYGFQKIYIDLVGPFNPSKKGRRYILTVPCRWTRWLEAFPLDRPTAEEVVRTLEKEIFMRFGVVQRIHSDRGPQMTSRLFAAVGDALNITITQTPSYSPRSNAVKTQHATLENMIRKFLADDPSADWEDLLPACLFAINTSVSRATGVPPYKMLFGRNASTPLDIAFGRPPKPPEV